MRNKINNFNNEKKLLLENPPEAITGWVERIADYGNRTVTKGKKYQVRNYFRYINTYGSKGEKFPMWDEFITIKNDYGFTVKMNLMGFKPCTAPLTEIQKLENRIVELEKLLEAKNG